MSASPERHRWPGTSSLVVPVPALESWVRSRHQHYDAAYVSSDPTFAHAHVTLLSPFVTVDGMTGDVQARVGGILADHQPFTVRLQTLDVFPDGVVHLVPEPCEPLRRITADLVAAFPAYLPYAGRVADVRPHLTLDLLGPGVDMDTVRASLGELVPAEAHVSEARLSWYEEHRCHTGARWPLGG